MLQPPDYYMNNLQPLRDAGKSVIEKRCAIRERMLVHSQGVHPSYSNSQDLKKILKMRPSESEETFRWRCDNYEPITQSVFERASDGLFRIFQDSAYSWGGGSPDLREFIKNFSFLGLDFELFIQQFCLSAMLEDPNGWLCWLPTDEMIALADQNALPENRGIDVVPVLVPSDRQIYDDGYIRIWRDEQKYPAENGVMQSIIHVLSPAWYLVFTLDASFNNKKRLKWFKHNLGEMPALTLGGKVQTSGIFKSFFDAFCTFGNLALTCFSDYQYLLTHHSYPLIQMRAIKCDQQGCTAGTIYDDKNGSEPHKCHACDGTGLKIRLNPRTILLKPENKLDAGDTSDMLKYISPEISSVEHMKKAYEDLLEQAERAINVRYTFQAQSGEAKKEDKQEFFSMLVRVSNNIFDNVMYRSLRFIELYRSSPANYMEVKVSKPTSFHIKDESELADELLKFQQLEGAYDQLAKQTYLSLTDKRFNGDPVQKKIAQFLIHYDPYCGIRLDDKKMLFDQGSISLQDFIRSTCAFSELDLLIQEEQKGEQWFLDASFEQIKTELDRQIDRRIETNMREKAEEEALMKPTPVTV